MINIARELIEIKNIKVRYASVFVQKVKSDVYVKIILLDFNVS